MSANVQIFLLLLSASRNSLHRDYIKEGAVVIDVGIHRNEQNKLCGDVDRDDVMDFVSCYYTGTGRCGTNDHRHADV